MSTFYQVLLVIKDMLWVLIWRKNKWVRFYIIGHLTNCFHSKNQLDVANGFIDYHTKQFEFEKPNVEFRLGKIEQLTDDPELKIHSFDVVVYVCFVFFILSWSFLFRSNCVVNLSPDKNKVLQQVYEMLKVSYYMQVYIEYSLSFIAWRWILFQWYVCRSTYSWGITK